VRFLDSLKFVIHKYTSGILATQMKKRNASPFIPPNYRVSLRHIRSALDHPICKLRAANLLCKFYDLGGQNRRFMQNSAYPIGTDLPAQIS
jgi:hypothetical protein